MGDSRGRRSRRQLIRFGSKSGKTAKRERGKTVGMFDSGTDGGWINQSIGRQRRMSSQREVIRGDVGQGASPGGPGNNIRPETQRETCLNAV